MCIHNSSTLREEGWFHGQIDIFSGDREVMAVASRPKLQHQLRGGLGEDLGGEIKK